MRDRHGGGRQAARQRWIDFHPGRFVGSGTPRFPSNNLISRGNCEYEYKAGELQGSHFSQPRGGSPNELLVILQYGVNLMILDPRRIGVQMLLFFLFPSFWLPRSAFCSILLIKSEAINSARNIRLPILTGVSSIGLRGANRPPKKGSRQYRYPTPSRPSSPLA